MGYIGVITHLLTFDPIFLGHLSMLLFSLFGRLFSAISGGEGGMLRIIALVFPSHPNKFGLEVFEALERPNLSLSTPILEGHVGWWPHIRRIMNKLSFKEKLEVLLGDNHLAGNKHIPYQLALLSRCFSFSPMWDMDLFHGFYVSWYG